ncbi:MAG: hypothetical protein GAK30_01582 [Paracidovorax wautersii]|uniref:Phage virion morphogenesis (Putative tail completion) protein n=1 Tax=Paracidovorax wautersii TaxID=1177982 RepID=A0A7V8JQX7_9BURK|nr:MAG: hypothetical protein GAK30_01582 [Paracidovorax wautersii]
MADLTHLATWASPLISGLSAARRRLAMAEVATYLRRSQAERIAAQHNPDGTEFEPRKPRPKGARIRDRKGKIRRKMFTRLAAAKYLRKASTPSTATLTIAGRAGRIARVHQYGMRDKVDWRQPKSPTVQYARRELLGFSPHDVEAITDILLRHITMGG